jgi:hypothetical protein
VLGQKRQGTLAEPSPREHCTKDLHARSLTNDEVYATVAYIFSINGIIKDQALIGSP